MAKSKQDTALDMITNAEELVLKQTTNMINIIKKYKKLIKECPPETDETYYTFLEMKMSEEITTLQKNL